MFEKNNLFTNLDFNSTPISTTCGIIEDLPLDHQDEEPEPSKSYHVVLYNDDTHIMDYVISVLQEVFSYSFDKSFSYMWEAHSNGTSICARGLTKNQAKLRADQLRYYKLRSSFNEEK